MKKGPIIHGVLLVVALVVAYQTWTRDDTAEPTTGDVVLWDEDVDSIEAIVYETETRTVRVERRGEGDARYLWGTETHTTNKPKPPGDDPDAEAETVTNTREFAVGEAGEEMFEHFAEMRALLSLGEIAGEEQLKQYELNEKSDDDDPKTKARRGVISVIFGDETRKLVHGGKVRGGIDSYVMDPESNEAWVVAGAVLKPLTTGETGLKIQKLHAFEDEKLAKVTIAAVGKERELVRLTVTDEKGNPTKTWADASAPDKPDQTMANLVKRLSDLRPARFEPEMTTEGLEKLIAATYFDAKGDQLGTLTLYKKVTEREPPEPEPEEPEDAQPEDDEGAPDAEGSPTEGADAAEDGAEGEGEAPSEGDNEGGDASEEPPEEPEPPALPPKIEYYLQSELTRVLVGVSRTAAERIDQDLEQIFE